MRKPLWIEIAFEFGAGSYVVAAVVLGWRKPQLLSLLLAAGLCIQFWFWREKADIAAMIAAALLGGPAEVLCTKLGVWTYDAPGLVFGIPIWIPLVWAFLLCFFRRVSFTIHSILLWMLPDGQTRVRKTLFGTLGGIILAYYLYTVSVIRGRIALAYTTFMIPTVIFWHGEKDILIFLFGATCGTLGEYICTRLGFWQYHYPFFEPLGMPISLPLAWGLSSVVIGRIAGAWEAPKADPETHSNP